MKISVSVVLLGAGLLGCQQPFPSNRLLVGHWEGDSVRHVSFDKRGQQSGPGLTEHLRYDLYVTPTHVRLKASSPFVPSDSIAYRQQGDSLVTKGTRAKGGFGRIKALTATQLTLEKHGLYPSGERLHTLYYYHRALSAQDRVQPDGH